MKKRIIAFMLIVIMAMSPVQALANSVVVGESGVQMSCTSAGSATIGTHYFGGLKLSLTLQGSITDYNLSSAYYLPTTFLKEDLTTDVTDSMFDVLNQKAVTVQQEMSSESYARSGYGVVVRGYSWGNTFNCGHDNHKCFQGQSMTKIYDSTSEINLGHEMTGKAKSYANLASSPARTIPDGIIALLEKGEQDPKELEIFQTSTWEEANLSKLPAILKKYGITKATAAQAISDLLESGSKAVDTLSNYFSGNVTGRQVGVAKTGEFLTGDQRHNIYYNTLSILIYAASMGDTAVTKNMANYVRSLLRTYNADKYYDTSNRVLIVLEPVACVAGPDFTAWMTPQQYWSYLFGYGNTDTFKLAWQDACKKVSSKDAYTIISYIHKNLKKCPNCGDDNAKGGWSQVVKRGYYDKQFNHAKSSFEYYGFADGRPGQLAGTFFQTVKYSGQSNCYGYAFPTSLIQVAKPAGNGVSNELKSVLASGQSTIKVEPGAETADLLFQYSAEGLNDVAKLKVANKLINTERDYSASLLTVFTDSRGKIIPMSDVEKFTLAGDDYTTRYKKGQGVSFLKYELDTMTKNGKTIINVQLKLKNPEKYKGTVRCYVFNMTAMDKKVISQVTDKSSFTMDYKATGKNDMTKAGTAKFTRANFLGYFGDLGLNTTSINDYFIMGTRATVNLSVAPPNGSGAIPTQPPANQPLYSEYLSTPAKTFSELKQGSIGNETFEAMSGTPTTRNLYFASGGSEYIVQIGTHTEHDKTAQRTYSMNWNDVQCSAHIDAVSNKTNAQNSANYTALPNLEKTDSNGYRVSIPWTYVKQTETQWNWKATASASVESHTTQEAYTDSKGVYHPAVSCGGASKSTTTTTSDSKTPGAPAVATATCSCGKSNTVTVEQTKAGATRWNWVANNAGHECNSSHNYSWTQSYEGMSYVVIDYCRVWKLDKSKITGMTELTGTDEIIATIKSNDGKALFNAAATNTASDGRMYYSQKNGDNYAFDSKPSSDRCALNTAALHEKDFKDWESVPKAFKETATCVSDYLILETTAGDISLCYFEYNQGASTPIVQTYATNSITAPVVKFPSKSNAELVTSNKEHFVGNNLGPEDLPRSGYNGNFASPGQKYMLLANKGQNINLNSKTIVKGDYSKAVTNSSVSSFMKLTADNIDVIDTTQNGAYSTGVAQAFFHNVVSHGSETPAYEVDACSEFNGEPGFIMESTYSPTHSKVNDIVIHNPVSSEYASIQSLESARDQRTSAGPLYEELISSTTYKLNCTYHGADKHSDDCYDITAITSKEPIYGPGSGGTEGTPIAGEKTWYRIDKALAPHTTQQLMKYTGGYSTYVNGDSFGTFNLAPGKTYDLTLCARGNEATPGEIVTVRITTTTTTEVTYSKGTNYDSKLVVNGETHIARGFAGLDVASMGNVGLSRLFVKDITNDYNSMNLDVSPLNAWRNCIKEEIKITNDGYLKDGFYIAKDEGRLVLAGYYNVRQYDLKAGSSIYVSGGGQYVQFNYNLTYTDSGIVRTYVGGDYNIFTKTSSAHGSLVFKDMTTPSNLPINENYLVAYDGTFEVTANGRPATYNLKKGDIISYSPGYFIINGVLNFHIFGGENVCTMIWKSQPVTSSGGGDQVITGYKDKTTYVQTLICNEPHHGINAYWKRYVAGISYEDGTVCDGKNFKDQPYVFPSGQKATEYDIVNFWYIVEVDGQYYLSNDQEACSTLYGNPSCNYIGEVTDIDWNLGGTGHYSYGTAPCYEAVTTIQGTNRPPAQISSTFINIDYPFKIYFPNRGDFMGDNAYGIGNLSMNTGKGFTDNMDTSEWLKSKSVVFGFDVIYKGQGYYAGQEIPLAINEGPYYEFYAPLENVEQSNATVEFKAVANNSPSDMQFENLKYKNKERTGNYYADHDAYKRTFVDVVGRIGNLMMEDTGDYRFSNFFKETKIPRKWLYDKLVYEVDITKQKFVLGDRTDIRGFMNINGLNTWGTQPQAIKAKLKFFPLTPAINNVDALKKQAMRIGYKQYLDVQTIGNYYGEQGAGNAEQMVQITPYYFHYNLKTGKVTPVDIYMSEKGSYKSIYKFGNTSNNVEKSYKYYLNWLDEADRRNYSTAEEKATQAVVNAFHETDKPVYSPSGSSYQIGSAQRIYLDQGARTFIGSTKTYGDDKNPGNTFDPLMYQRQAQRWHFTLGLPSSAVFIETGKSCTTDNIKKLANDDSVIVTALDILACGQLWNLRYNGEIMNQQFEVIAGHTVDVDKFKVDNFSIPIVGVMSANKSSADDLTSQGTH